MQEFLDTIQDWKFLELILKIIKKGEINEKDSITYRIANNHSWS